MKQEVELELKTLVTKEQFEKLVSFYQPLTFIRQHNYYYVTNDIKHYGFRIRLRAGEQLFTLKQKKHGQTMEYEKVFVGELQNDPEIVALLAQFQIFPPYHLFGELITERAVVETDWAELCFDINHYNGQIDYELEYEVKQPHDYQTVFFELLKKADILYQPSWGSKYQRCLASQKSSSSLDK